jgi:PTS system ascorbate-specific IIA component
MIATVDEGDGVLLLADLYGATPCNVATRLIEPGRIELVAGVNLPMLLRLLTHRDGDLDTLVRRVVGGAGDGVTRVQPG